MPDKIINTAELAVLILLPLIIFYQRSQWKARNYAILIPILYLIWYGTYGLFHELSHLLGIWASGKEIYEFQLIPKFWKGDYGTGFVNYDFQGDKADLLIILLPYLRDLLFCIGGYILFMKMKFKSAFLAGLTLILLILSPLYDVMNNYLAYVLGSLNDFNAITVSSNSFTSHGTGVAFILIILLLTGGILRKAKYLPADFTSQ